MTSTTWLNLALAIILPQIVLPAVLYPEENDSISYVNDQYRVEDDTEGFDDFPQSPENDLHRNYDENTFIHQGPTIENPLKCEEPAADEAKHHKDASDVETETDDDNSGSLLQDLFRYISGNSDTESDVKKHNKREYPDDADEEYGDNTPAQGNTVALDSDSRDVENSDDEDIDEEFNENEEDDDDDDDNDDNDDDDDDVDDEDDNDDDDDDDEEPETEDNDEIEERTIKARSSDSTNLLDEIDDDTLKAFYTFIDNTITDHVKNITSSDNQPKTSTNSDKNVQTSMPPPTVVQSRMVLSPAENRNRSSLPYNSKVSSKTYKSTNNTNINVKLEKDLHGASEQINEGRIPRQVVAKEVANNRFDPFQHSGDNQVFVHVRDENKANQQDAHKPHEYDYRYQNAYDAFQKDHEKHKYENFLAQDEDYNYGYNFPKMKNLAKNYETKSCESLPVVLMKVENMDSYSNTRRARESYQNGYQYPDHDSFYQPQTKYKRDIDHVTSSNNISQEIPRNDDRTITPVSNKSEKLVPGKAYVFESVSINNSPYYTLETFTQDSQPISNAYKINDVIDHGQQIKDQIECIPNSVFTYLVDSFLHKKPESQSNNSTQDGILVNIYGENVPKQMQKRDLREVQESIEETNECQKNTIEALEKVIACQLSQCDDIKNENLTESERRQLCRNIIMRVLSEVSDENVIHHIIKNYESLIGNCETQIIDNQCVPYYCGETNDDFEKTFINIKNLNIFYEFGESGQNCINVPNNRIQYTLPCSYPTRRISPARTNHPNQVGPVQSNEPYSNAAAYSGSALQLPSNQYELQANKHDLKSLKETEKHRIDLHQNEHKSKVAYKREDIDLEYREHNSTNKDLAANENDTIEDTMDSDNRYAHQNITTFDVEEQKPLIVMDDNNPPEFKNENSKVSDETSKRNEPTAEEAEVGDISHAIKENDTLLASDSEGPEYVIALNESSDMAAKHNTTTSLLDTTTDDSSASKLAGSVTQKDEGVLESLNKEESIVEVKPAAISEEHDNVANRSSEIVTNDSDQPIALKLHKTSESDEDSSNDIVDINNVPKSSYTLNSTSLYGQENTLNIQNATNSETGIEQNSVISKTDANNENENSPNTAAMIEQGYSNSLSQVIQESEQSENNSEINNKVDNDIVLEERVREQKDEIGNTTMVESNTEETNEIANEESDKFHKDHLHGTFVKIDQEQVNESKAHTNETKLSDSDLNEGNDAEEQDKRKVDSGSTEENRNVNMKYKSIVYKKEGLEHKKPHLEKLENANITDEKATIEKSNIETDNKEQKYEIPQKHDDNSTNSTRDHHGVYNDDIYCKPHYAIGETVNSSTENNDNKEHENVNENDIKKPTESDNATSDTHIDTQIDEQGQRSKRKDESDVTEKEGQEEKKVEDNATEEDEDYEEKNEDYDENDSSQDEEEEYEEQEENDDYEETNYEIYEPKHHDLEEESQDDVPIDDENDEEETYENDTDEDKTEDTEDFVESENNELNENPDSENVEEIIETDNGIAVEEPEKEATNEEPKDVNSKEEAENDNSSNKENGENGKSIRLDNLAEEQYKEDEESEQIRTAKSAREEEVNVKKNDDDDTDYDNEEYVRKCDVEKLILDILESKPHPDHELRHSDMFPHRPNNKYKELVKDIASYFAKKNITSGDDICVYEEYGSKRGDDDVIILSGTKLYKNGITKTDGQNYNLIIKKPHEPSSKDDAGSSAYDFIQYKPKDDVNQNDAKLDKISLHNEKKIVTKEQKKSKGDKSHGT